MFKDADLLHDTSLPIARSDLQLVALDERSRSQMVVHRSCFLYYGLSPDAMIIVDSCLYLLSSTQAHDMHIGVEIAWRTRNIVEPEYNVLFRASCCHFQDRAGTQRAGPSESGISYASKRPKLELGCYGGTLSPQSPITCHARALSLSSIPTPRSFTKRLSFRTADLSCSHWLSSYCGPLLTRRIGTAP